MNRQVLNQVADQEQIDEDTEIIIRVREVAKTHPMDGMDLLLQRLPSEFNRRPDEYFAAFKDIHHRAQRDAHLNGTIIKEKTWPISFPDCTLALRQFVNRWIEEQLPRESQAKCLILIGPTNTGKTTFAKSLPGLYNYFAGVWDTDSFNPYAKYTIYENILWDEFESQGYPDKKTLLTQDGPIHTIDNRGLLTVLEVYQPAIVLLNPGDEGSLKDIPSTKEADETNVDFWSQHAYIYRLDNEESFYKRRKYQYKQDNFEASSNSSMDSDEERMEEPNEWEKMYQHFKEKHTQT